MCLGPWAFSYISEGETCPCSVRQHLNSLSCKPPGGHQIQSVPAGGSEPPSVDLASPCKSLGNAFARCAEQVYTHAFSPKASTWRVETKPSCGSDDLGEVQQSKSRPVCFQIIDTLSAVVLCLSLNQPVHWGRMHWLIPLYLSDCLLFAFPPLPLLMRTLLRIDRCNHTVLLVYYSSIYIV